VVVRVEEVVAEHVRAELHGLLDRDRLDLRRAAEEEAVGPGGQGRLDVVEGAAERLAALEEVDDGEPEAGAGPILREGALERASFGGHVRMTHRDRDM
jgi:hypothetical protein